MTKAKLVIKFDEDDYFGKDFPRALILDNDKDAESFLTERGCVDIKFDTEFGKVYFKHGAFKYTADAFWATYL